MKKAYLELIKKALAKGYEISVHDGECWEVKRSTSYKAVKDCIESVEVAELRFRSKGDEYAIGWAMIIPDLAPDETIADYTANEYMEELIEEIEEV